MGTRVPEFLRRELSSVESILDHRVRRPRQPARTASLLPPPHPCPVGMSGRERGRVAGGIATSSASGKQGLGSAQYTEGFRGEGCVCVGPAAGQATGPRNKEKG